MKKVILLFLIVTLIGCDNEEEGGVKITGIKEHTMVVASQKLQGLLYSDGFTTVADVYAVKIGDVQKWQPYEYVDGFDYENGCEYVIKVKVTSYVDKRRRDSSWSTHDLLEVISKEKKDSEELPEHFIPDWYTPEH